MSAPHLPNQAATRVINPFFTTADGAAAAAAVAAAHRELVAKQAQALQSGPPPGASSRDMNLTAENAEEFWTNAWENELTGWKGGELMMPYTRNLYVLLQYLRQQQGQHPHLCFVKEAAAVEAPRADPPLTFPLAITTEMHTPQLFNGAAENAWVKAQLHQKHILVPLCGDTTVIPYFVEAGAALVIGADLSEQALQHQMAHNFPGVTFQQRVLTATEGGDKGEPAARYTVFEAVVNHCLVRLFLGDFLALPQLPLFRETKVDFVYDRASFMAINPALRRQYVATIASVLQLAPTAAQTVVLQERPVREEGDTSGPPFTYTKEEVKAFYEEATAAAGEGHTFTVAPVLEDVWRAAPERKMGMTRYFDWLAVYPSN